jgi:hypothetical protein
VTGVSEPPRLPVPAEQLIGRVLDLAPAQMRYRSEPLRLRVRFVREDISLWYGGEFVWLEGEELDADGEPIGRLQALIAVDALA